MNGLQFLILASPTAGTLLDISPWIRGARFAGNKNGFTVFGCKLDLSLKQQSWLYDRPGLPELVVNWMGARIWEGRLEDSGISSVDLGLQAFGHQRALSDVPYSGLWSYTRVDKFRQVTTQDSATRSPEKYAMDTNNRVFMGLRKNETYANNSEVADWTFSAPHNGSQGIYRVEFDYAMLLPANWSLALQSFAYDFTSFASEWSLAATGILQTGTVTQNIAAPPKDRVDFRIVNATGAPYNYVGETGANYARITNLKIKGTTSATLYASEIVNEFIGHVNSANSLQLSSDTNLVVSPGLELRDEMYNDADMREILDRLALVGDSGGNLYEWVVWGRQLAFRRRGLYARVWYVDIAEPDIDRTLDALINSVYATYQEAGGATLRTATSADAFSVTRYGLTRRAALSTQTTSSTQATTQRDTFITDRKTPIPRVDIRASAIYDAAGQPYPVFLLRANDTLVIRNLPPSLTVDIDRLRRFRVEEYEYDVDTGVMSVVPESPPPSLDVLLARQANAA